ncbi:MAG: helix-turn-helix domain-containing protein [Pseudomonadota bacterium]
MDNNNDMSHTPLLMTVRELAMFLGLKESWLRAKIFRKKIPFIKLGGGLIRFDKNDVLKWLETQKEVVN